MRQGDNAAQETLLALHEVAGAAPKSVVSPYQSHLEFRTLAHLRVSYTLNISLVVSARAGDTVVAPTAVSDVCVLPTRRAYAHAPACSTRLGEGSVIARCAGLSIRQRQPNPAKRATRQGNGIVARRAELAAAATDPFNCAAAPDAAPDSARCREKLLNMDQTICGFAYDNSRWRFKRSPHLAPDFIPILPLISSPSCP